jgi:hypothetical protein
MKTVFGLALGICVFVCAARAEQLGVPTPDNSGPTTEGAVMPPQESVPRPAVETPTTEPLPPQRTETRPSGPVVAPPREPAKTPESIPQAAEPRAADKSACGPRLIEQIVYVPMPVREMRKVECVEYTTEARQQTVTVMHAVSETQTITRDCVVMVPEKRTRTENYTVCKKVPSGDCCGSCKVVEEPRQRVIEYTVCVPQKKTVSYDVTTCKLVPEERAVTVNVCVPHTVEREVEVCAYRMTAKKVVLAPACPPRCCCGPCCNWGCCW